jgi:hypothetical protein
LITYTDGSVFELFWLDFNYKRDYKIRSLGAVHECVEVLFDLDIQGEVLEIEGVA